MNSDVCMVIEINLNNSYRYLAKIDNTRNNVLFIQRYKAYVYRMDIYTIVMNKYEYFFYSQVVISNNNNGGVDNPSFTR